MPNNTAQESEFFAAIKIGRSDDLKSLLLQAPDLIDFRGGDGVPLENYQRILKRLG